MRTFRKLVVEPSPAMAQPPSEGQGLLTIDASRSPSRHIRLLGRTPLDEWSARRRDLCLTKHNTHKREIHNPLGFEPAIPGSKRPQTHALDHAGVGIAITVGNYHQIEDQASVLSLSLWAAISGSTVQAYKSFSSQQMSKVREEE